MNEALAQSQCYDTQRKVPNHGLGVEEGLQHLLQINLHYGTAHARGDVSHLLQILLLGLFLP